MIDNGAKMTVFDWAGGILSNRGNVQACGPRMAQQNLLFTSPVGAMPCCPNLSWEASKGHTRASAAGQWRVGPAGLASCWPCRFVAPPVAHSQSTLAPVTHQRAHTTQALPLPERSRPPPAATPQATTSSQQFC